MDDVFEGWWGPVVLAGCDSGNIYGEVLLDNLGETYLLYLTNHDLKFIYI